MLRKASSLKGYAIQATDDELGSVKELYFDDRQWGVRYLVVETGGWLSQRSVLLSPYSIKGVDEAQETVHVSLTREQVKNSPDIDTHQPISRQLENQLSDYYGYGNYWSGPYLWGVGGYPVYPLPEAGAVPPPPQESPEELAARAADNPEDVHLRSSKDVTGYHIAGTDDEIGHVEDFIIDDEAWAVRYLLVDTRNWWPGGKKVLLATHWIERIEWSDSTVWTTLTREQIKNGPEYDEDQPLDRDYETRLHQYYGRNTYWD
ncbi:PRC-barrel domain-containing protein [Alcaligenaceae bacterium]|nr:PRC-barrel domain-containing protein [Alcaligenaceae bacterium]